MLCRFKTGQKKIDADMWNRYPDLPEFVRAFVFVNPPHPALLRPKPQPAEPAQSRSEIKDTAERLEKMDINSDDPRNPKPSSSSPAAAAPLVVSSSSTAAPGSPGVDAKRKRRADKDLADAKAKQYKHSPLHEPLTREPAEPGRLDMEAEPTSTISATAAATAPAIVLGPAPARQSVGYASASISAPPVQPAVAAPAHVLSPPPAGKYSLVYEPKCQPLLVAKKPPQPPSASQSQSQPLTFASQMQSRPPLQPQTTFCHRWDKDL